LLITELQRACITRTASCALEAHDWFLLMMRSHDEFEVETDRAGEWPVPFCSETVRQVVVE
jgi:hypothetical protein